MTLGRLFKNVGLGWLSLSLLGMVVGMLAAFLDWQVGRAVVLGSISSLVLWFVVIGYLGELAELFHRRGRNDR